MECVGMEELLPVKLGAAEPLFWKHYWRSKRSNWEKNCNYRTVGLFVQHIHCYHGHGTSRKSRRLASIFSLIVHNS